MKTTKVKLIQNSNMMKKLFFSLLAVVISAISFAQLNESNVGDFHNQKMNEYYINLQKLAKSKEYNKIKKDDFYFAFTDLTKEVFGDKNPSLLSTTNADFLQYMDLTFDQQVDLSLQKISNANSTSKELKEFLIVVINHCRKNNDNEQNIKFLKTKLIEAQKKFKGNEFKIVEVSLNTGISSFIYWESNYKKWNDVFGTANASKKPPVNVGVADLAGATVGAMYGAVGGTAFLPGVGTVAGAVGVGVAGGLYASTVAAVTNFYSYFF